MSVINHQQNFLAIKAIFRLNTIITGSIHYNATNVTDEISSYIKRWYYKMNSTSQKETEDFIKSVN